MCEETVAFLFIDLFFSVFFLSYVFCIGRLCVDTTTAQQQQLLIKMIKWRGLQINVFWMHEAQRKSYTWGMSDMQLLDSIVTLNFFFCGTRDVAANTQYLPSKISRERMQFYWHRYIHVFFCVVSFCLQKVCICLLQLCITGLYMNKLTVVRMFLSIFCGGKIILVSRCHSGY